MTTDETRHGYGRRPDEAEPPDGEDPGEATESPEDRTSDGDVEETWEQEQGGHPAGERREDAAEEEERSATTRREDG